MSRSENLVASRAVCALLSMSSLRTLPTPGSPHRACIMRARCVAGVVSYIESGKPLSHDARSWGLHIARFATSYLPQASLKPFWAVEYTLTNCTSSTSSA